MQDFGILEGIPVSLFSILIVFIILLILAFIISLLKYLPSQKKETTEAKFANQAPVTAKTDDEEERLVAMLVASCVAKESVAQDVRIISIERTK